MDTHQTDQMPTTQTPTTQTPTTQTPTTQLPTTWTGTVGQQLAAQLDWHWQHQLRPRLDGLTDAEYFWEPVEGSWGLRRRGEATSAMAAGAGDYVLDFAWPEPVPAPVTTIAWRLGHIAVGVFGMRVASHFGGVAMDYPSVAWPETAGAALDFLDQQYAAWIGGVRGLSDEDLARPCGSTEPYPDHPLGTLILHINREAIHHGAEIALLRDLYAWRSGRP